MKNTSLDIPQKTRIEIVEDFIQTLVNSGHKYAYIKAIVLQGITKYLYMVERSRLDTDDKRYMPLYRKKEFKMYERMMLKYIEPMIWYSDVQLKDPFRNIWKRRINIRPKTKAKLDMNTSLGPVGNGGFATTPVEDRSGLASSGHDARQGAPRTAASQTTTTFFVPPSKGGQLARMIKQVDQEHAQLTGWNMKILEKSGKPLINFFMKTFPMILGCPRGPECIVCDGNAKLCAPRGWFILLCVLSVKETLIMNMCRGDMWGKRVDHYETEH